MFSVSTDNAETARALLAVQCIMDGHVTLCDCPEWLRSAIPALLGRLRALEAEQEEQAETLAVLAGCAETQGGEMRGSEALERVPESQRVLPSSCPDDPYDAWAS